MRNGALFSGIAILLGCMVSCDTSFNPGAAFQSQMAVYSVLTTQNDTQYVRIYTSYNRAGADPAQNPAEISVTDAVVKITGTNPLYDARTYDFQRFDLNRPDQRRYKDSIRAYYCFPFRPIRGASYRLTVVSPTYGRATADLTVPTRGSIKFANPSRFVDPWYYPPVDIQLSISLSTAVRAYLVSLYIEYDMFHPETGEWIPNRTELPFKAAEISKALEMYVFLYPKLTLRQSPQNSNALEGYTFQISAYQTVVYSIVSHADRSNFRRVICYLMEADEQLYRYYEEANRFNDRNSIRLDQPNYTNIQGGVGLFAAIGIDSVEYQLPGGPICPPPGPTVICH